jgi:hypothetical protein
VIRSVPQAVSLTALAVGVVLFVVTLTRIDIGQTLDDVGRLGVAFPALLIPGACWHLLRTWGWWLAFPDHARPPFVRLFRVRLATDAISFFTIRGTSEPLRVMMLYDRVPAPVTTAAIALERVAFAVVSLVIAGLVSYFAVQRLSLSGRWNAVFTVIAILAVLGVGILVLLVRRRGGDVGRIEGPLGRWTGHGRRSALVVRFLREVQRTVLELLRGDRRRLMALSILPVVCYGITTFEVWLVLWAVGEPAGLTQALAIETFARLGSVASAAIPANVGALEIANAAPVAMLGLGGGGALALLRRIRALVWAALGLALYPRVTTAAQSRTDRRA